MRHMNYVNDWYKYITDLFLISKNKKKFRVILWFSANQILKFCELA